MPSVSRPSSPGYGRIAPILLGLASIVFFLACLPLLDRNARFTPMEAALHARVVDYIENLDAAEGQLLRVRLHNGDKPLGLVTTRDDRPWRTFAPDERVRLLVRPGVTHRGSLTTEYIVDDFAAKWGGLIARAGAAVLCDIAAVAALLLGRRRPSAATRFPPTLPRTPAH